MPKVAKLDKEVIVTGPQIRTNNSKESNPETGQIMNLWDSFHKSSLLSHMTDPYIYGIYSDYESDVNGDYTVTAGICAANEAPEESYNKVTILPGKYLVFDASGKQPESIIKAWQAIWSYFAQKDAPKRKYTADFEKYSSETDVEIYVAVED